MLHLTPPNYEKIRVASSVIEHTIYGDGSITGDVESIRNLMSMNCNIKKMS